MCEPHKGSGGGRPGAGLLCKLLSPVRSARWDDRREQHLPPPLTPTLGIHGNKEGGQKICNSIYKTHLTMNEQ